MNDNTTTIQRVNPINKEEEKKKFFFDTQYNPQFAYAEPVSHDDFHKYGPVSDEHLALAAEIVDSVVKTWKTETEFLKEVEGETMSREEVEKRIREYLKGNGIEDKVQVQYSTRAASPASMAGNTLNIRLPIAQRELRFSGTLNHEIGTHFFRRLNDRKQPWHKDREKYGLLDYLDTEEGLAVIHAHLDVKKKALWFAALYYYIVHQSERMSFAELFEHLEKYVENPDRRWNMCVRSKRGVSDTSVPGAFSKDQVYLRGTVAMLRWLETHEFDPTPLYIGKIAVEDLEKAQHISPDYKPVLPVFLHSPKKRYAAQVQQIMKENNIK